MKRVVALTLVLCVAMSFLACTKEEPIQTGIKLEDIIIFSGTKEDYREKKISKYKKEFSYICSGIKTEGVLSGEDIIEITWTIPEVYANGYTDFKQYMSAVEEGYLPQKNDEYFGTFSVVMGFSCVELMFFNIGSMTVDDMMHVLLNGKTYQSVDWKVTGKLDTEKNIATINVTYQS